MNVTELKEGDRIRLIQMGKDPDPILPGAEGTITFVTDLTKINMGHQIGVAWDNGRNLSLCVPEDTFEVIRS